MIALLSLYSWTILAGFVAAPALALLGCQLATRDRAMQTMCVGQGAMVGVLIGIGFLHAWESTPLGTFGPFGFALVLSALTLIITDKLVVKYVASKNTTFAFIFALLISLGYLVSSLFPSLESHMAQVYFGDLATLAKLDSQITIVASLLCLAVLGGGMKPISNQSFEWAIFGEGLTSQTSAKGLFAFKAVTLVMLCFSIQFVGFLFTISMLFIPTALMNFLRTKGLKLHFTLCAITAAVSTVSGFTVSLRYTRLPTVPAIVAVLFGLSLLVLLVERGRYSAAGR